MDNRSSEMMTHAAASVDEIRLPKNVAMTTTHRRSPAACSQHLFQCWRLTAVAKGTKFPVLLTIIPFLPVVIVFWRAVQVYWYGTDSTCKWLLQTGYLTGDLKWQPRGCNMYWYSENDAHQCFRNSYNTKSSITGERGESAWPYMVVSGDSRMRGVFEELASTVGGPFNAEKVRHHGSVYRDAERQLKLELVWNPYGLPFPLDFAEDHRPSLMVAGRVLWYMHSDQDILPAAYVHEQSVRDFAELARSDARDHGTQYVWRLSYPIIQDSPDYQHTAFLFNQEMETYRKDVVEILKDYPEILLWTNVAEYLESAHRRGVKTQFNARHPKTYEFEAQVILNLLCNRFLKPSDRMGACCNGAGPEGILESVFRPSLALKASLLLTLCTFFRRLFARAQ